MVGRVERICQVCGSSVGFTRSDDGFFYCGYCNSQADDIFDTGVDEEQFFSHYSASCNRVRPANAIAAEPISQVKLTTSQYLDHPDILVDDMEDDDMGDGVGPSGPSDFGSSQKNFSYEDYYSEIRSRYLTGLQRKHEMYLKSFSHLPGEVEEFKPSAKFVQNQLIFMGSAWEGVTPSDILKWTLEGKLPYFAAFGVIEKQLGSHSEACPIRASRMFRPIQAISSQKLEAMAADIAQKISLELPPVNFYAIAFRYCRQLSLPVREILPQACRICEWSMPSELYLSANEFRIPTRSSGTKSEVADSKLSVVELLQILEGKYNELDDVHAYSSDLPSYLQYCKDVVFSGLRPSYEDLEEEKLLEEFWEFYQKNKASGTSDHQGDAHQSRPDEVEITSSDQNSASCTQSADESPKIRQ
ncbi:UNVERIFIED_CONTAM: TATA box-binding protein-associated factor RNA polymerase I subunit B [Sesamum calycinum]|uniref:TATA box-binding protein-associated factor RNA polymerase I subunit B n=1 Tax=Sesamum calycinum TaxID=2727403 RepID=A0AAW2JAR4_9LAMI